jgi:anti-sigma factor RsiW|nr:zf-HC2 domain-containing protein [Candidatus Krumholzibacteria bacterium]
MKKINHQSPDFTACEAVVAELAPYCAGELDRTETAGVEDHLDICPECRAELQRERHLRAALSGLPLVACPQRVTDNILREIEATEIPDGHTARRFGKNWVAISGWATAAAVAALLVFSGWPQGQDPRTPPQGSEYSAEDIALARRQAAASLRLAAVILNQTERSTVQEVFGQALPTSLTRSIKVLVTPPEGGQG